MAEERWTIYACRDEGCDYVATSPNHGYYEGHGHRLQAVEVVPASSLDAALKEARELRAELHRVEGDCAQWKHAAEEWERSARSVLVSGERGEG